MVIVNNKGFTLIELLAVVVIITIILLISVPIVLNTVNMKRASQYRKSVDTYGNDIEVALERYKIKNNGLLTTDYELLKEYLTISDEKVKCKSIKISENGIVKITNCSVSDSKVLDENGKTYVYETVNKK